MVNSKVLYIISNSYCIIPNTACSHHKWQMHKMTDMLTTPIWSLYNIYISKHQIVAHKYKHNVSIFFLSHDVILLHWKLLPHLRWSDRSSQRWGMEQNKYHSSFLKYYFLADKNCICLWCTTCFEIRLYCETEKSS